MTGLHPHQTGIGHMTLSPRQQPQPNARPAAYQGFLNQNCITIAQALGSSGYSPFMAGKWHLGMHDKSLYPLQRGFTKFFGSLPGATRYFYPEHPRGMTFGNTAVEVPESTTDKAFYTTDAFTDYAIQFIHEHESSADGSKPFFLYLAYTAPHWPLQAFEDDIAKYRGQYRAGWQALREARYKKQIALDLISNQWPLSSPTPGIPLWDSLSDEEQDEMDLKMSIYAAMIDSIDQNIGKLIAELKSNGEFDNTLILFLSDNGGCAEGGKVGRGEFRDIEKRNLETSNSYGEAWANASCTPFRLYKHFAHEGGTASPFLMHWPNEIAPQSDWYGEPAQLIDVMPTLLDIANASYPTSIDDRSIPPLDGVSLRPAFQSKSLDRPAPLYIEHENNAFVREGRWKLVGRNVARPKTVDPTRWELYDMQADRTETYDLAIEKPDVVKRLADQWNLWADRAKVYPKVIE
jgi:arylsulfatase